MTAKVSQQLRQSWLVIGPTCANLGLLLAPPTVPAQIIFVQTGDNKGVLSVLLGQLLGDGQSQVCKVGWVIFVAAWLKRECTNECCQTSYSWLQRQLAH